MTSTPGGLTQALADRYRLERGPDQDADLRRCPERQVHRLGLAVANGRFYFTLSDRTADLWVAAIERK